MTDELRPTVSDVDHVRGEASAGFVLAVFGDYECPDSAALWRFMQDVRASGGTFQEVFRHFPLTRVHPHAWLAAQAAEAADDQNMFWSMHDELFEHQQSLELADLMALAKALGLDVERFDEDLAYGTFEEPVRANQRSGVSSGVVTTPTVFVNGRRVEAEPRDLPKALAEQFGR